MTARAATVQDRLIPSKKVLRQLERDIKNSPHETAETAIAMLEEIRHDAREGWLEKYHGKPVETDGTVNIYRNHEADTRTFIVACVRCGALGPIGHRYFTLDSARFAAAAHATSHKEHS